MMDKETMFASDLDQTLIYSRRMMSGYEKERTIRPLEWLEGRVISFMTRDALALLNEIAQRVFFVPVTTRTRLQYRRLDFHAYAIEPQYAVTGNGGTIYFAGREDEDWRRRIAAEGRNCLPVEDLLSKFAEISRPSWVHEGSGRLADELFYYCLIERDKVPVAELNDFSVWSGKNNWDLSIQGRKLYLVPRNVSKKAAVQYIKEKEEVRRLATAGDSLLDLEMLRSADLALAPAHGELYALSAQSSAGLEKICFTQKSGLEAAEEILRHVVSWIASRITPYP